MSIVIQDTHGTGAGAQWDSLGANLFEAFERYGPFVFGAAVLIVLGLALRRAHRYRLHTVLTPEAETRVHAAIVAVEKRTSGEVVPVVLGRSDAHPVGEWRSAAAFAFFGSVLLEGVLPWHSPVFLILCQVGLAAIGFFLARGIVGWKRLFIAEQRATDVALEQASIEFQRLELHRTEGRTGVLIFVSLFERRVIVLGDSGIHAVVGDDHWVKTRDAVLTGIDRDDLAAGLIASITACGDVLCTHFPIAEGNRNEIPDRLVVREE